MSTREPDAPATAASIGIPWMFNAATYFVDRHIDEGRGEKVAIECGSKRVTYMQRFEAVNRLGSALRDTLDVRCGAPAAWETPRTSDNAR